MLRPANGVSSQVFVPISCLRRWPFRSFPAIRRYDISRQMIGGLSNSNHGSILNGFRDADNKERRSHRIIGGGDLKENESPQGGPGVEAPLSLFL